MTPRNPHAGKSIIEIIWEDMDDVMDLLKEDPQDSSPPPPASAYAQIKAYGEDMKLWGEQRGRAQGLAYALAVLTNPYAVNVDEIKKEAMKRWEERNANQD